jgi:uncharacterized RDD family membrane protein YckC
MVNSTPRVSFVTPENIEVSYELAGIGSRFLAAFIDHLFQILLILALWLVLGFVSQAMSMSRVLGGGASLWVQAALLMVTFVVLFGYFTAFELAWAGRTPGKRVAGLRVVRDNGYPIDAYSSLVRNLIRVVDFIPAYGIGLVSIFVSREYKRLGDFAAGTIVIKERPYSPLTPPAPPPLTPLANMFRGMIVDAESVTSDEYLLVRRFLDRRSEMDPVAQAHLATRLAHPLLPRLGIRIAIPVPAHYIDLLQAFASRYTEERGVIGQ